MRRLLWKRFAAEAACEHRRAIGRSNANLRFPSSRLSGCHVGSRERGLQTIVTVFPPDRRSWCRAFRGPESHPGRVSVRREYWGQYTVTLAVLHFREETEGHLQVEHVSFPHQPEDADFVERVLACPVRVGQSWAGFALTREAWELPLRRRESILRGVLERQADEIIAQQPAPNAVTSEVRRVLASRIARGDTQIQSVARALSTSTRSLQRRLAAVGLSYDQLLDQVRKEAAERYLSDSPLSITEIAYLLSYSEPAVFNRAFRRWYEQTRRPS